MSNLLRFDPFFTALDPLFAATNPRRRPAPRAFAPGFEVRETEKAFVLYADLPGVAQESLDIALEGRELTITGSRAKAELAEGDKLHLGERFYGTFKRTFELPEEVDTEGIDASLEHGVLTVSIPKQPATSPRKIPIRTELPKTG